MHVIASTNKTGFEVSIFFKQSFLMQIRKKQNIFLCSEAATAT